MAQSFIRTSGRLFWDAVKRARHYATGVKTSVSHDARVYLNNESEMIRGRTIFSGAIVSLAWGTFTVMAWNLPAHDESSRKPTIDLSKPRDASAGALSDKEKYFALIARDGERRLREGDRAARDKDSWEDAASGLTDAIDDGENGDAVTSGAVQADKTKPSLLRSTQMRIALTLFGATFFTVSVFGSYIIPRRLITSIIVYRGGQKVRVSTFALRGLQHYEVPAASIRPSRSLESAKALDKPIWLTIKGHPVPFLLRTDVGFLDPASYEIAIGPNVAK